VTAVKNESSDRHTKVKSENVRKTFTYMYIVNEM